jgi:hypothetical protein
LKSSGLSIATNTCEICDFLHESVTLPAYVWHFPYDVDYGLLVMPIEGTAAPWASRSGRRRPRIEGLAITWSPFDSNHTGYVIAPRPCTECKPSLRRIVAGDGTQHASIWLASGLARTTITSRFNPRPVRCRATRATRTTWRVAIYSTALSAKSSTRDATESTRSRLRNRIVHCSIEQAYHCRHSPSSAPL